MNQSALIKANLAIWPFALFGTLLLLSTGYSFAGGTGQDLGSVATSITSTFTSVTKLITAGSYLAGLAFSIGAIMKFKQHKDNPTQIPIGTPIALILIAAALLFLPSILDVAGYSLFGKDGGKVSGPTGGIYTTGNIGSQS